MMQKFDNLAYFHKKAEFFAKVVLLIVVEVPKRNLKMERTNE